MVSELSNEQELFLEILRDILHKKNDVSKDGEILPYLKEVLRLSSIHMVLPLVVDMLYEIDPERMEIYKKKVTNQTACQAAGTASFILLYQKMREEGLYPVVLKGIVCRNLYPEPELRSSVDEDLLISPDEIHKYHEFLLDQGFQPIDPELSLEQADEISYKNLKNHLYLEIHKYPFACKDNLFGGLNSLFEDRKKTVTIKIYNTEICSLDYTDQLLYMICHAYKHLIYSGIGIRQLCDMTLFAETYGKMIDWDKIVAALDQQHFILFGEALLKICVDHLGMDLEKAGCSRLFQLCEVDELPLLKDIVLGGIYGAQDENRLHSANMTLSAVSARKQGKRNAGLATSLFPSYSYMSGKYTYLKKYRFLLPVTWLQRIYDYLRNKGKNVDPGISIEIGKQRVELLKKYKLL